MKSAEEIEITASQRIYDYQAPYLLVSCVDFRLQDEVTAFMQARGLIDQYDHLILPGAALGALNPQDPSWGKAFFSQLRLLKKIHGVQIVIIMDHRDCGLYKAIFGLEHTASHEAETQCHYEEMMKVKGHICSAFPDIQVELLLMDISGKVETLDPLSSIAMAESIE